MDADKILTDAEKRTRVFFVSTAFVLLSVIIIALVYLATSTTTAATATLPFAGGVSNIFLPCTLPLAFVIVPMSMGMGYRKGLTMALLFGLGLVITLAFYGAAVAVLGKYLGLDQATRIMYVLAGVAALLFGLSELKLISLKLPAYTRTPKFIEEQSDYLKVFFLGLFLGNAGVGRALPLIFLSVLGILGVNALLGLLKRKEAVDKFIGWSLVALASFITLNGVFGHLGYEGGVFHEGLNMLVERLGGARLAEADIPIEGIEQKVPFVAWGAWANFALTLGVLFWYWWERAVRHLRSVDGADHLRRLGAGPDPGRHQGDVRTHEDRTGEKEPRARGAVRVPDRDVFRLPAGHFLGGTI